MGVTYKEYCPICKEQMNCMKDDDGNLYCLLNWHKISKYSTK